MNKRHTERPGEAPEFRTNRPCGIGRGGLLGGFCSALILFLLAGQPVYAVEGGQGIGEILRPHAGLLLLSGKIFLSAFLLTLLWQLASAMSSGRRKAVKASAAEVSINKAAVEVGVEVIQQKLDEQADQQDPWKNLLKDSAPSPPLARRMDERGTEKIEELFPGGELPPTVVDLSREKKGKEESPAGPRAPIDYPSLGARDSFPSDAPTERPQEAPKELAAGASQPGGREIPLPSLEGGRGEEIEEVTDPWKKLMQSQREESHAGQAPESGSEVSLELDLGAKPAEARDGEEQQDTH